ncbi:MAG: tail fiber domain-containing protein [Bacteroidia bacterium]
MEKYLRVITFSLITAIFAPLSAQVPQGINFQAVARDASGIPMANTNLSVRFSIQDPSLTTVYQETHTTVSDVYGLFDLVIGKGTPVSGTFSAIDWGSGQHQVVIEVDAGAGYANLGTCVFQSVPYALYSENGSVWSETPSGAYYNNGRVSIGTNTPQATLHLADTSNVLVGAGLTGSGFKLLWYGAKGAMRFGYLTPPFGGFNYDKFWDYDSVGYYSFAGGQNARAKGFGSFAWGSFGWADGSSSVAFFGSAKGNNSFTFGGNSKGSGSITFEGTAEDQGGIAMYGYAGGRYGVAIGGGTTGLGNSSAREDYSVAIGWNADAHGEAAVALGPSDAYGYTSFSTGFQTQARGNYASSFGYFTTAYPYGSMALGRYNISTGDSAAWVATDPVFMIGDGTSNTVRSNSFVIQKNGQTAIGYDSPVGMLQISSALGSLNNGGLDPTHSTLLLGTTTTGLAFDPNQIEVIGSELNLNFNSPQNIIMANGGGSVGIGTSAPSDRFHIAALAGENALRVQINGTTAFRVHSNGGVSIGVNSVPTANGLVVNGITQPFTDNTFTLGAATRRWTAVYAVNGAIQTSDYRLKTDIHPLTYGLDEVLRLRPVSYHWKEDDTQTSKIGMIAQELFTILPEVVYGAPDSPEDEPMGVNYGEMVPVLVKAIQEQQEVIDGQQAKILQMEQMLLHFSEELNQLKQEVNQK